MSKSASDAYHIDKIILRFIAKTVLRLNAVSILILDVSIFALAARHTLGSRWALEVCQCFGFTGLLAHTVGGLLEVWAHCDKSHQHVLHEGFGA